MDPDPCGSGSEWILLDPAHPESTKINARLPSDSAMITRNASTAGICIFSVNMFSVNMFIVPAKPKPPNHPNSFWAR